MICLFTLTVCSWQVIKNTQANTVLLSLIPGQNKQTDKQHFCRFGSGIDHFFCENWCLLQWTELLCLVQIHSILNMSLVEHTNQVMIGYTFCCQLLMSALLGCIVGLTATPSFWEVSGHLPGVARVLTWHTPHAWITKHYTGWYQEPTQSWMDQGYAYDLTAVT